MGGIVVNWDELTSPELHAMPRWTPVLLPVAATEQHGPHLPLATDRIITERFARALSQRASERLLVLPVMAVGCSGHHLGFAGTLSIAHHTLIALIDDVLGSVAGHGFTNLIVLNGHGGNAAAVQVALESFGARHPDCRTIATSWWRVAASALEAISETGPGGVGHAGEFETSLLMHMAPEMVRTDAIAPRANLPTFDWAEGDMLRTPRATLYRDMKHMTSNGAYGEPAAATAARGRAIEDAVLAALEELISTLAKAERAQPSPTTT